jgi:CspA family cold shock protein
MWAMNSLRKETIGLKGKIMRLIRLRGFGFISTENGEEVFFHRSALEEKNFDTLEEGTSVEFNLTRGPKGLRAANVRVAK